MRVLLLILLLLPGFAVPAYAGGIYEQAADETGIYAVEEELPETAREISGALKVDGSYDTENALERLWHSFADSVKGELGQNLKTAASLIAIAMLCAVTAAYACSRWRFKGRRPLLMALLVLNAFPQVLSLFAYYRILRLAGLLNSHIGLMLIYAGSMCVFAVWNMKGYFDSIPVEIEEASKIDGANDAQMIWRIVLPLAKPAIVVTCVMVLITVWNEYLFATTFLLNSDYYSLSAGLYQLQSNDYTRSWPLFTAASILASIPLLLIFFKIQKYMVSGLTAGGVKG